MVSVFQDWLSELPIRMQSTLVLGLRGDDTQSYPDIKKITRWMRGLVFRPGNPANVKEFMTHTEDLPVIEDGQPIYKAIDYCTLHYYSHLIHSLEVIAYMHPDDGIRFAALRMYNAFCDKIHLVPESRSTFLKRLEQLEWPGGKQPENFDEAMESLDCKKILNRIDSESK